MASRNILHNDPIRCLADVGEFEHFIQAKGAASFENNYSFPDEEVVGLNLLKYIFFLSECRLNSIFIRLSWR
jgi:hypothetical protein